MKSITMICIDTINQDVSIKVMNRMLDIFGHRIDKNIFFTDIEYNSNRINIVKINKIQDISGYNEFVNTILPDYIDTDFCMIVQHDGYIINPEKWSEDFLEYDYIGAPWREEIIKPWEVNTRVGNGGFSIRSKSLMDHVKNINIHVQKNINPKINKMPEDVFIARVMEHYNHCFLFESAPIEIASRFSFEYEIPERNYGIDECFGMHGFNIHPELKEKYKI